MRPDGGRAHLYGGLDGIRPALAVFLQGQNAAGPALAADLGLVVGAGGFPADAVALRRGFVQRVQVDLGVQFRAWILVLDADVVQDKAPQVEVPRRGWAVLGRFFGE